MREKKRKSLAAICICLASCMAIFLGVNIDVLAQREKEDIITSMDENGEVCEVEPENGYCEDGISAYTLNGSGQIVNLNTKGAVITNYEEDQTGIAGYLCGAYGADAAYLGKNGDKIKFMVAGVTGWVNASEVQVVDVSAARTMSHYTVSSGRLLHRVTYNISGGNYASSLDNGPAPTYLEEGKKYYSYDGHYFYTEDSLTNMFQDYSSGVRGWALNKATPFYNYFQYLPLRSQSNYSSNSLNQLINAKTDSSSKMYNIGTVITEKQNTYGVNGLLTAGVAANESAWGKSSIAMKKNNLFGLNAVDSSPGQSADTYSSVEACVKAFTETYMSKRYLNPGNWVYFGGFLGNKASGMNVKYASDPYWGEKAAAVAWMLDRNGGSADQYKYSIGIKGMMSHSSPHTNVNVRAENSVSSTMLYQMGKQRESAVLVLDKQPMGDFYKIQSDPVLKSDRSAINKDSGNYKFSDMYAYVSKDYVGLVDVGVDRFSDCTRGAWYYQYVEYVFNQGIMTGLNQNFFGTSQNIARAQFATILYRMSGMPKVNYEYVFPDVPEGMWFTEAVLWGNSKDIMTGYSDTGFFGVGDFITREQMAAMMYRYAQYMNYDISDRADIYSYPDAGEVNAFAEEAMQWAVGSGIISGENGKLNPQGTANRAVCATIVTRFLQKNG